MLIALMLLLVYKAGIPRPYFGDSLNTSANSYYHILDSHPHSRLLT